MQTRLFASILALGMFSAAGAKAECSYPPFSFHPETGGAVMIEMTAVAGTPCTHNFREGPGYRFDSVEIERLPEKGDLKQTDRARFVFTPAPRFAGKDFYMIKICATKEGKSGCQVLAFVATVGK